MKIKRVSWPRDISVMSFTRKTSSHMQQHVFSNTTTSPSSHTVSTTSSDGRAHATVTCNMAPWCQQDSGSWMNGYSYICNLWAVLSVFDRFGFLKHPIGMPISSHHVVGVQRPDPKTSFKSITSGFCPKAPELYKSIYTSLCNLHYCS